MRDVSGWSSVLMNSSIGFIRVCGARTMIPLFMALNEMLSPPGAVRRPGSRDAVCDKNISSHICTTYRGSAYSSLMIVGCVVAILACASSFLAKASISLYSSAGAMMSTEFVIGSGQI